MNRGADRQDLFSCDDDHRYFHSLHAEVHDRFGVDVLAHCSMTNHFHSLLRSNEGLISEALQYLAGSYAGYYNRRYERTGPVFDGRFRSVLVTSDEQLLATARYIHRNPLDMVPLSALASYAWSSYPAALGRCDAPDWLVVDRSLVLGDMGPSEYRTFVETPLASDTTPEFGASPPCGTIDDTIAAVAAAARVHPDSLLVSRRGAPNAPRLVAIALLVEQRQFATAEIAGAFGLATTGAVRNAARRARVLEASDPGVAALRRRAITRK